MNLNLPYSYDATSRTYFGIDGTATDINPYVCPSTLKSSYDLTSKLFMVKTFTYFSRSKLSYTIKPEL